MDNISDILTIVALIFNFITLLIVLYQTKLSKEAYEISERAFNNDKMIKELEQLPKINFVIHVNIQFDKWIRYLTDVSEQLYIIKRDNNGVALKQISENAPKTCKGLVESSYYEQAPEWLQEIYMCGAKYYYNSTANLSNLWDNKNNLGRLDMLENKDGLESIIERIENSLQSIKELQGYINNKMPMVILNTPESISDRKYLSED